MIVGVMISPWVVAGWCLGAYLIGGLPVGWLLVRRKRYGLDLRNFGSGNIGTSNAYRHAGVDIAVIVGPLQFAQGFLPVLAARLDGLPLTAAMLVGVCTVAGNGWPVYMRFNGGRGVAVATGAVAALSVAGLIALLMCFAWGAIRGRIAIAVLVGFVLLPVVAFLFGSSNGWVVGSGCLAILVLLVLRRLEGLPTDARVYGHFWRRVYQRLIFDERPGRPLMGPRTDPGADTLRH
jgi:glycerol-3-phosphate acyltransferase PlsY